jgi:hypothetical protein
MPDSADIPGLFEWEREGLILYLHGAGFPLSCLFRIPTKRGGAGTPGFEDTHGPRGSESCD